MLRAVVLLAVLMLAGCAGPGGSEVPTPSATAPPALNAPWWNIGESWTVTFTQAGQPTRTTTLVNFANNSFGDPPHFWLGTSNRQEALDHVFFDNDPFLGRIHHEILSPHEKGMHSGLYSWPMKDGASWTSPILFGKADLLVQATQRDDGTFAIAGEARADGSKFAYDYDPDIKWFRNLKITSPDGTRLLDARVTDHKDAGASGTFFFLRGRDYLDADGGATGESERFTVTDEGATGIAFLLNVRTSGPATIEFVDPSGNVAHRETIPLGGASDKIVEIKTPPAPGEWRLRYVGTVTGTILVRGIIEYKATL